MGLEYFPAALYASSPKTERGSCAFIYPDKVNGQKAHLFDSFANDQDWTMVFWLEHGPDFK